MGLDVIQFRDYVFNPCFEAMRPPYDSPKGRQQTMFTVLHESDGLKKISQVGSGYARGPGQTEPPTYNDIWRYLREDRPGPRAALAMIRRVNGIGAGKPVIDRLYWDMRYSICMVRMKYWMNPEPLPELGDFLGVTRYWSENYQTSNDPAKEAQFLARVEQHAELMAA